MGKRFLSVNHVWFMLKSPFPVLLYNEYVEGEGMQYLYLRVMNQAPMQGGSLDSYESPSRNCARNPETNRFVVFKVFIEGQKHCFLKIRHSGCVLAWYTWPSSSLLWCCWGGFYSAAPVASFGSGHTNVFLQENVWRDLSAADFSIPIH